MEKEQILAFFKSLSFDFLTKPMTDVDIITSSYNPFDKSFMKCLEFDNNLYVSVDKNDEGDFTVSWGKSDGWVGGLMWYANRGSFIIPTASWENVIKGFTKRTEPMLYLVSRYGCGGSDKIFAEGTFAELETYALSNGYERIENSSSDYVSFRNTSLSRYCNEKILTVYHLPKWMEKNIDRN